MTGCGELVTARGALGSMTRVVALFFVSIALQVVAVLWAGRMRSGPLYAPLGTVAVARSSGARPAAPPTIPLRHRSSEARRVVALPSRQNLSNGIGSCKVATPIDQRPPCTSMPQSPVSRLITTRFEGIRQKHLLGRNRPLHRN